MATTREYLDNTFFKQEFPERSDPVGKNLESLTYFYVLAEEGIAVLSDLKEKHSTIFYGNLGWTLGISQRGTVHQIDSIWEEELLSRIPEDELEQKQLLEVRLVDWVGRNGTNWILDSVLTMSDENGQNHLIRHKIRYFMDGNSIRYALCLYNPVPEKEEAVFHNLFTGERVPVESIGTKGLLSDRELEVLSLIEKGASSKDISSALNISIHTVSRHRQNILEKLRAANSTQACRIAKGLHLL